MKTTKIYLAHALTDASELFRLRMFALRAALNRIENVKVLEFNWKPGLGPDPKVNTYTHDMKQVRAADLMVAVVDYFSSGVGMEIKERCHIKAPLLCFTRPDMKIPQIVRDCIAYHRSLLPPEQDTLPDFIPYGGDDEIVFAVADWIKTHPPKELDLAQRPAQHLS